MRKPGLVAKMTLMTFVFFMVFLLFALFLQGTFFESFYLEQKIDVTSEETKQFAKNYTQQSWDAQELKDNISLFRSLNGEEITVLDHYGIIKNEPIYQIIIEDRTGKVYRLHLNHALSQDSINVLSLKPGDTIEVYGFLWPGSETVFKPMRIVSDQILLNVTEDTSDLHFVRGKIIGLELPTFSELNSAFYKQPIREVILEFMIQYGERYPLLDGAGYYQRTFNNILLNQLIFYHPINGMDNKNLVLVLGSQRHIGEAKEILEDYHTYVMMLSFILLVFLSYFYSRNISKPILILTKSAQKMAKLDFSQKIVFKRKDEIGSLSQSLNTLSTNLSNSMDRLRDTNKKLTKEIEKERQLEQLRKDFVSGVSHELKTPLGIIRGYAEGVRDEVFDDTNYYLDVIIEETEKMDKLVVDMLELSKLESENFRIQKTHFNLRQLIDFVMNKFEYAIMEKKLRVEFHEDIENSTLFADEFRIEQVLVNYFSNALRYAKKQTPLYINLYEKNQHIMFEIENIGDPIPEDKIDKVWNRFYCVDAARNKSEGGTGLGLAIVRNIIELHDGLFGAKNTDRGVLFYFSLPKNSID
jgi:signal transduction histidine kinase